MSKKGILAVPLLLLLLTCSAGCVVNKAISASAVANNLAVEKAQNEMLLLNVLRAKDHRPMHVTGISKINGQVKAEASLGVAVPFGSVGAGPEEATHYVASPSASYNWNPNFDVNVFDNSEFMIGFMAPLKSETVKLYLDLGFDPRFLFHLLVLQVQVRVKHGVCASNSEKYRDVDEYIFRNNHESGSEPNGWMAFAQWLDFLLKRYPRFEKRKPEPLGPPVPKAQAVEALVQGLKKGFTLADEGKEDKDGKADEEFRFQRLPSERWVLSLPPLINEEPTYQTLYEETVYIAKEFEDKERKAKELNPKEFPNVGVEVRHYRNFFSQTDAEGCPNENSWEPSFEHSLVTAKNDNKLAKMTITLSFRSPESALYYLGEHARFEHDAKKVLYICMFGELQPMFVALSAGQKSCKSSVVATTGDGATYYIPAQEDLIEHDKCNGSSALWELKDWPCDPGRSMHALTVVSQLIALQKAAKNLPTTSVVRVVGQ